MFTSGIPQVIAAQKNHLIGFDDGILIVSTKNPLPGIHSCLMESSLLAYR